VGVGVQKSGTSWWHKLVLKHPDCVGPVVRRKELHFFDEYWQQPFDDSAVDWYHRLFDRPAGVFAGEWTPGYMYDFWMPPLLQRAAPDARLLVLLRDPVDRYRSGLAHEERRMAPAHPVVARQAFERGLYWLQLERLLRCFDRTQILVLQLEVCREDPAGQLERTFRFIGLPEHRVDPTTLSRPVNSTPVGTKPPLDPAVRDALATAYAPDVARLVAEFPEIDLARWPGVAAAVQSLRG
jgi:hypothetical protein